MIVAVDVDYRASECVAAAVAFETWSAATSVHEEVVRLPAALPYRAGELWVRELPPVLAVLAKTTEAIAPRTIAIVVVDAYVWLPPDGRAGLGARLHEALGVAVVGVAKTELKDDTISIPVLRGTSLRPLRVGAAGLAPDAAAAAIAAMHGPDRMPTLLRRADRLARDS